MKPFDVRFVKTFSKVVSNCLAVIDSALFVSEVTPIPRWNVLRVDPPFQECMLSNQTSVSNLECLKIPPYSLPQRLVINVLVEQFQTIRQQYLGKLNSLVASGTTSKIAVQQRKCDVETPFQPDDVYNNGIVDTEIDVPIYDTRKRSSAVSAASSNANVPKKRRGEPASDHSEIPSHTSRTHTSPRKFTSPTKKMSQKDVTVRSLFRKQETRNPSSTSSTSSQLQPGIEEQVNCPICNKCVLMKFLNPHLDSGCETHVHHTTAPRIEIPERDEVVNSDIEVINEITRPREDVDYSPIKEPQESGTRRSTRSSRRLASSQADTAKLEPMPSIPQPSLEQEMARISSYLKQDNSNKATKKPKSSVPYSMLKDAKIRSLLTVNHRLFGTLFLLVFELNRAFPICL